MAARVKVVVMRMLGCWRWMLLVGVLVGSTRVRAAEIVTTEQLRRWVVGLMDADPAFRETSRVALMGLSRAELATLAAVVQEFRPLERPMAETLRDVVEHVYLTGYDYEKEDRGFLGITMPARVDLTSKMDVVVESRMPGFVGYRMLQDGDVITDIEERPLGQPVDRNVFCDVVRAIRPGALVHLKVLRRGSMLRVPVRMDARPRDKTGIAFDYEARVQELLGKRAQEAEAYWRRAFEGERTATVEQK
jgi:hypothetical protein